MKLCKILAALLALLTVLSLVACGGNPAETSKTPDTTTPPIGSDDDTVKDDVPADLNFKNDPDNTITFFVRSNTELFLHEICSDELTKDTLYDAIHYRNMDVESRLGVEIKQIEQLGSEIGTDWQTWNETLATSVLTNTQDYDAAAIHTYCGSVLALQNIYADLLDLGDADTNYMDLSKPWWNQKSVDNLTVGGSLYFVGGSMMISEVARTYCLFFNKDLFNEKFPQENYSALYDMVDNKTWTIDKMLEYVSVVWDDNNSNGEKDDGDTVGFSAGASPTISTWVYALGMNMIEKNNYDEHKLSYIYDPNIIPAFENVSRLYNPESDGVLAGKTWKETFMDTGKVLFTVGYLGSAENWRESSVNYGVLPLPMFDEEQDYYSTGFVGHASALAICSNVTEERLPMLTATLEVMAAKSYNDVLPAYYNKVLQGVYSKEERDAQMYDLVLQNVEVDLASCYFPRMGDTLKTYAGLFNQAKNPNYDIGSVIDSNKDAWETAFWELLESLENVGN